MSSAEFDSKASLPEKDQHLIAGRYRKVAKVGHGRLGEIFSALDEGYQEIGVEQRRIIQLFPEGIVRNSKLFRKLSQGYSELRASSHPNLVDYIECGRDGKFGFLVMERLDGASLRELLDNVETLPLEEVKPVIRGVGEALRLLHAKELVHGNLTTRNVFITEKLEAKLLDVVPINPVETVVRSSGNADPFSRCAIEDDVFGLACLAFEMLTGRHPFNHSTQAEASAAGLEAERIGFLSDGEWNALHQALSLDREARTSSVAEFVSAFGIDGGERLQPSHHQPIEVIPAPLPAVDVSTPPARTTIIQQPAAATPSIKRRPARTRPPEEPGGQLRPVLLAMLFASLGAWLNFGEPEESAIAIIGYLDETLNLGLAPQTAVAVQTSPPLREVTASDRSLPPDVISEAVAVTPPEPTQDEPMIGPPEPVEPGATEDTMSESFVEVRIRLAEPTSTDAVSDLQDVAPESIVTETDVTVSEGDGIARIVPRQDAWPEGRLIWWTSEYTATADEDFVPINQEPLVRPPGNESSVLLIPLINDNLPERDEAFFVNFGLQSTRQGQLQRIAIVQVNIVDDD